ncbi:LexA family transcriptional regulator [Enterococcus pallens]|uniref:Peptidase S24/S26A/S26B/S26C domain-containing protein n=1 Tax=Enterococcus pallens ATCC BAA-351 TaxID=1158607 RepID=R2S1N9_9ENTE|nr:LexA family transcriptional regulator [Enterococcus pallens]EOH86741.1 hypothetical protein UAU_05187 [Enterococcus pallens ATCC BAA-351]EOU18537.1 hypothetical protein I588_03532 [Enterococcus pallens ATCC BAA-351]
MPTLSSKLLQLKANDSYRKMADRTGVSHNYLRYLITGQDPRTGKPVEPSADILKRIANAYPEQTTYPQLLKLAGYLDSYDRKIGNEVSISGEIPEDYTIPILGRIAASSPAGLVSDYEGSIAIQPSVIKRYGREDIFALRVLGDSMNRIIPEGSIAIIHKCLDWEDGDICAVTINGDDATLKQVAHTENGIKFTPLSYSKFHAPWEYVKDEDEVDVIIHGVFLYGIIPTDKM